jgi:hypothetical protein
MHLTTKRLLKILITIFLTYLISCSCQTKNINEGFIVPNLKTKPFLPVNIYLPINLILDRSGRIFYYQEQILFGSDDVVENQPNLLI